MRRTARDGDRRSGQALVEACLGLAMLSLLWMLMSYTTFMANNFIRTAMAARHAAWLKGSGGNPSDSSIHGEFFFNGAPGDNVHVTQVESMGLLDPVLGTDVDEVVAACSDNGPSRYQVSFGILHGSTSTTYPLSLHGTGLPIVPEMQMDQMLQVSSFCQWAQVGECWKTIGSLLSDLWAQVNPFG